MTDESAVDASVEDEAPAGRGPTIAALAVLLVVIGLVVVLATREPAANRIAESPVLGEVREVAGTTMDGGEFDLRDRRGRYVLVNFFATWCGPCVAEHDDLVAFHDRHVLRDAEVVSVVFDDSTVAARQFFADRGGDFPVIVGDDGRIALDFGVLAVPESFLVGPDGTILVRVIGGVTVEGLEELLARAKAGTL